MSGEGNSEPEVGGVPGSDNSDNGDTGANEPEAGGPGGSDSKPDPAGKPEDGDGGQAGDSTEDQITKYKRIARHMEGERDSSRREYNAYRTSTEAKLAEANGTAAKLTADLAAAQGALLRYEVGGEMGLTMKQCLRLRGNTAEELKADAMAFRQELAAPAPVAGTDSGASGAVDMVEFMRKNRNRLM